MNQIISIYTTRTDKLVYLLYQEEKHFSNTPIKILVYIFLRLFSLHDFHDIYQSEIV